VAGWEGGVVGGRQARRPG